MRLGGDTGENRGELAGIAWEEMGWMGVGVGMAQRGGQAAGPAAEPPTRAEPVCFDAVETACGRWGEGFGFWERAAEGEGVGRGGSRG